MTRGEEECQLQLVIEGHTLSITKLLCSAMFLFGMQKYRAVCAMKMSVSKSQCLVS